MHSHVWVSDGSIYEGLIRLWLLTNDVLCLTGEGEGGGGIHKKYLARVVGKVPEGQQVMVDQPIRCKGHREAVMADPKP